MAKRGESAPGCPVGRSLQILRSQDQGRLLLPHSFQAVADILHGGEITSARFTARPAWPPAPLREQIFAEIQKMQIWLPPQKIFVSGFTYLLRMTLRFCQTDKEKSSKSFSDLLLSLAADGRWIFSFESSGQVGPMMDSTINSCFPLRHCAFFLFLLMIIFFIINQCTYNNSNPFRYLHK